MTSTGIANWHWRTKDCKRWAEDWFKQELLVEHNGVKVTSVSEVSGDCEVGMRKSKLITIYDLKITTEWAGVADESVNGSLTAVEVSHDMSEEDYVFESALRDGSGAEAQKLYDAARKGLADLLRKKFQEFPKVLVATHGKALLVDAAAADASGGSSPAANSAASSSRPSGTSTPSGHAPADKNEGGAINTSSVSADGTFMCSAEDLFDWLTNEQRIPVWSRNPAKMKPEPGTEYALFGGNISGKVISVERPKKLVQTWRAPTWPEGHFGTLTTTFAQGSDSTVLNLSISGVPVGKEDETEHNLQNYYIIPLKQIGWGLQSLSSSSPSSRSPPSSSEPPKPGKLGLYLAGTLPVLFSLSLIGALIAAILKGPTFK